MRRHQIKIGSKPVEFRGPSSEYLMLTQACCLNMFQWAELFSAVRVFGRDD